MGANESLRVGLVGCGEPAQGPTAFTCPVCGGESVHVVAVINWGEMRRCLACDLIFANPLELPQEPREFFDQAYLGHIKVGHMEEFHRRIVYRPDYSEKFCLQRCLDHAKKQALNWIKANVASGSTVLDIGCGRGDFLYALQKAGFRPVAVEPAASVVQMLQKEGFVVWHGTVADIPHGFPEPAVCTCFLVLHHSPDPVQFLSDIRRRFPDAPLVISEGSAWSKRRPARPPRHLTLWSIRSLRTALGKAGYAAEVSVVPYTGRDCAVPASGILLPLIKRLRLESLYYRAKPIILFPLAALYRVNRKDELILGLGRPHALKA